MSYLNRGMMLCQCEKRGHVIAQFVVPDIEHVIIAATGQVATVRGPAQPADILCVIGQLSYTVLCYSDVMVMDGAGTGTTEIYCIYWVLSTTGYLFVAQLAGTSRLQKESKKERKHARSRVNSHPCAHTRAEKKNRFKHILKGNGHCSWLTLTKVLVCLFHIRRWTPVLN